MDYSPQQRIAKAAKKCKRTRQPINVGDLYVFAMGYGAFKFDYEPKSQEEADRFRTPSNPKDGEPPRSKPRSDDGNGLSEWKPDGFGWNRVRFESVSDMHRQGVESTAVNCPKNDGFIKEKLNGWLDGNYDWANNHTRRTLANALIEPRKDAIEAMETMMEELSADAFSGTAHPTTPRRRNRRNLDVGDRINPDKFLSGDPMMWERMEKEPVVREVVRIGLDGTVSCNESQKDLLHRGAAAIALARHVEASGRSVEIVNMFCCTKFTHSGHHVVAEFVLKSASQPMDITCLLACMADIGYARVCCLSSMVRTAPAKSKYGMGIVARCPQRVQDEFDVYMPSHIKSHGQAVAWYEKAIAKIN